MQLAAFTNWWHLWGEITFLIGDCLVIVLVMIISKMQEKDIWWWLIPMIASTLLVVPDLIKRNVAVPLLVILSFIGSIATLILFLLYLILRNNKNNQSVNSFNPIQNFNTVSSGENLSEQSEPTVSEEMPTNLIDEEMEEEKTRVVKHTTPAYGWFVGMSAPIKGKRFDLNENVTSIGRSSKNDIVIGDDSVSKEHAKVKYIEEKDMYKIYDLVSTNGTYINGKKIEAPVEIHDGDEIEFGEAVLVFKQIKKRKSNKGKVDTEPQDSEE